MLIKLLIAAVVVVAVVVLLTRKPEKNTGSVKENDSREKNRQDDQIRDNMKSGEKSEAEKVLKEKTENVEIEQNDDKTEPDEELKEAKKALYQYINQALKGMYGCCGRDDWGNYMAPAGCSELITSHYDEILNELPAAQRQLVEGLFGCISPEGEISDREALKKHYLSMMLPFYPQYYKEMKGIRYTALLSQDTLELFRRLTGKRYRMGYRNRFENGVTAFEWKGNRFKVSNKKGQILCDAEFKDGQFWNGYAFVNVQGDDEDWIIVQKKYYKDGKCIQGDVQYTYQKPCC